VLKQALVNLDPKRLMTPVVNRTLHTYHNTLRILCEAFQTEFEGRDHRCERLLVQEAFRLHRTGKMLVPIIDDAHLMQSDCLRKLRLLFEDFPHSHNLVLIGQPPLLQSLALSVNEEIRSRVTYSVILPRLGPEATEQFILAQLDRAGLGHNTFTPDALALIVRSGEGLLRRTRNLCLASLIEAVRDQVRTVDLKQVNHVLIQPHWRHDCDKPLN
jgi:type II secretory pathway predicted ATPase ExeA